MCPPGCYHDGFMVTPELGHMMYGYTLWGRIALWYIYILYMYTINFNFQEVFITLTLPVSSKRVCSNHLVIDQDDIYLHQCPKCLTELSVCLAAGPRWCLDERVISTSCTTPLHFNQIHRASHQSSSHSHPIPKSCGVGLDAKRQVWVHWQA